MAEINAKVKVGVEGTDSVNKLSSSIKNLSEDLGSFGGAAGGFSNVLGSITGKLGPVGLAATAAGAAFAALGMRAVQIADQIADISDATGVSAGALLNFKQSIIEAGGGFDDFSVLATKFNQIMGDAAEGNEKAQKSFQKLGVYVTDSNGKVRDTETVMREAIARIAAIDDASSRAAIAVDFFGKSAAKLDFTKLNAGKDLVADADIKRLADYQAQIDRVRNSLERGLVSFFGSVAEQANAAFDAIDRYNRKIDEAEAKANAQGRTYRQVTLPGQEPLSGPIGPTKLWSREMTAAERAAFSNAEMAKLMAPAAGVPRGRTQEAIDAAAGGGYGKASEAAIKAAADSAKRIAQAQTDAAKFEALRGANNIQKIEVESANEIAKARLDVYAQEHLSDAQKAAEFAAKRLALETKAATDIANVRISMSQKAYQVEQEQRDEAARAVAEQEASWDRARVAAGKIAQDQTRITEAQSRRFEFDMSIAGMSERQAKNAQTVFDLEEDRLQTLRAIAEITDLPYADRLAQEENVNKIYNNRRKKLQEQQALLDKNNRSFVTGWDKAMSDYLDSATNAATQAEQIFSKVTSSMEDAFVNFAKTGKFEFKSMINSIIEDLLRMQIKASLAKVMGLGGSTGATGGLFGGKIIPGILASGGPVSGNRPYIVGERGPELFMPGVNGQMFPNSSLGGGQSVIYNIQAVDAPSFQALVARDPSFIHAVAMAGARAYPR